MGLIPGFPAPGRQHTGAVMISKILECSIDFCFMFVGYGDSTLKTIGYYNSGYATEKMKRVFRSLDQIFFLLGGQCFNVSKLTISQYSGVYFNFRHFTRLCIYDRKFFTRVIDKNFFTGMIFLVKASGCSCFPSAVMITELRITISIRMNYPVFAPEHPTINACAQ